MHDDETVERVAKALRAGADSFIERDLDGIRDWTDDEWDAEIRPTFTRNGAHVCIEGTPETLARAALDALAEGDALRGPREAVSREQVIAALAKVDRLPTNDVNRAAVEFIYGPSADAILALFQEADRG